MVNDAVSSVREETLRIGKGMAARNYWSVLGIPPGSDYKQIKTAHRKWVRKLHPDRWFAITDPESYRQIHEAFYQVQVAYFETLKQCAAKETVPLQNEPPITNASPSESPGIPFFSGFIRFLQKIRLGLFRHKTDAAR